MTVVRLRPLAEQDLMERTRYYRNEAGDDVAQRSFDAAVAALDALGRIRGAGSPRVGEGCGIPALRFRRVVGFPCGWFCIVGEDQVDVARLLFESQDLAAIFAADGSE